MSFAEPLEQMVTTPSPAKETVDFERPRAYPFLKWAGGKRSLVPAIAQLLPRGGFGDYWEPFLGGGAVFFGLDSWRHHRSHLSDINADLVLCWRMVQTRPETLIEELREHVAKHCELHFQAVREADDEPDPIKLAARFVYLNKTCFNGLYRVNKSGKFNVPMGSYRNPAICDADNLRSVSEVLASASLRWGDFEGIAPVEGDLVYCDPPYDGTFTGYDSTGFDDSAQQRLSEAASRWADDGAHVIVSNSDTPLIRSLWGDWRLVEVNATRQISCDASRRGKVAELLIVSA